MHYIDPERDPLPPGYLKKDSLSCKKEETVCCDCKKKMDRLNQRVEQLEKKLLEKEKLLQHNDILLDMFRPPKSFRLKWSDKKETIN